MPIWIVLLGWITKAVLVLLVVLSIWSVQIMLERKKYFSRQRNVDLNRIRNWISSSNFQDLSQWISEAKDDSNNTEVLFIKKTVRSLLESKGSSPESIDRFIKSLLTDQKKQAEKGLLVLGALGSNAPFIGLFGTVLGIIQAFGALSQNQSGNMNLVMAGISEALIATAVGLLVAIPAVIAYNYFSKQTRQLIVDCDSLKDLFISQMGQKPKGEN